MSNTANAVLVMRAISNIAKEKGTGWLYRQSGSKVVSPILQDGLDTALYFSRLFTTDVEVVEVTDEAREMGVAFGLCRYFRVALPHTDKAVEAVCLVEDMTDDDLSSVRIVRGRHGMELVSITIPPQPTNVLHFIVGNPADPQQEPGDNAVLYTWYPGRLTKAVAIDGVTVKLNGNG